MVTKALFLDNSYLKENETTVLSIKDDRFIVLGETIFYPRGGGQPSDTGRIRKEDQIYDVVYVAKSTGEILHEVDRPGLVEGDMVRCSLDWERRYRLMRSHTAAHVFSSLLCNGTGTLITGNQLEEGRIRFDFDLENFNREILQEYMCKANELFCKDNPVKWYELPREVALKIPGLVKMAGAFPPDIPRLRIVEVVGVDRQADGGTHVKNLKEVGELELLKMENKGTRNRRVYFRLVDKG